MLEIEKTVHAPTRALGGWASGCNGRAHFWELVPAWRLQEYRGARIATPLEGVRRVVVSDRSTATPRTENSFYLERPFPFVLWLLRRGTAPIARP